MSASKVSDESPKKRKIEDEDEKEVEEEVDEEEEDDEEEEEEDLRSCTPNASAFMSICRLACLTGSFITVFTEEHFGIFVLLYLSQVAMRVVAKSMADNFDEYDRFYIISE